MISKELLSEVLGQVYIDATRSIKDENKHFAIGNKHVLLGDKGFNHWNDSINIYELSHKCKEWAYKRGFLYWYENSRLFIKIMYSCKVVFVLDIGEYKKPFEIDIDFKACQWILDNKEGI